VGYIGDAVVLAVSGTLNAAFTDGFPVIHDVLQRALNAHTLDRRMGETSTSSVANTPAELFEVLDADLAELERRLDAAEAAVPEAPRLPGNDPAT
jgi:hypothetical protein